MDVHETARKGFQKAAEYDAYRPSYSDETIDFVLELLKQVKLSHEQEQAVKYDVLELGAGTGKFTKKLLQKSPCTRLLATEPLEGFLGTLRQQIPDVETLQCTASDIPVPDRSVKAVVCAQCFHWFADVKSLTEIGRILVPNGLLILVWNRKDQGIKWVDEFYKTIENYKGDNPPPQYNDMRWKEVFNVVTTIQYVNDYRLKGIKFEGPMGKLLDNACSVSYIHNLDDSRKNEVREKLRNILVKQHGDIPSIDMPHFTTLHLYKKIN